MMTTRNSDSKRKRCPKVALAALCIGSMIASLAGPARAAELSEPWTSVRALGMGNAYSSVVNDSDSLFYNPAGLARISGFHWTVFDLRAGLNGMETVERVKDIASISDDNLAATLDKLYGKPVWAGGGGKTAITMPGFGIAAFGSGDAGVFLENRAYPTMNLNYYVDYGVAAGVGFDIIPEFVKFGIVGRRVNRTGTTLPLGPAVMANLDTEQLKSELKRRGTGYGLDVGFLITAPGPVKPSLSFVWKNIGYTAFSQEEGAGAPPRIEPEMILGGSLEISAPLITITPSADYKHVNDEKVQLGKKLHFGLEVSLPLIDIRAGLNQGYYTAGVGLDLGIFRFDAATYGVELGVFPGQHEDRRYIGQITFELGFEPGKFGLGGFGGSGERRRLKQRR